MVGEHGYLSDMQIHSLLPWHWFSSELRQGQTSSCVNMAAGKKQVVQDALRCYKAKRQGQQAGGGGNEGKEGGKVGPTGTGTNTNKLTERHNCVPLTYAIRGTGCLNTDA